MFLRERSRRAESGQALLLVLVFVAAFLILIWAALTLASAAFLAQSSVTADTRSTYALDAGLDYAVEVIDIKHGNGCNAPGAPAPLVLSYPTGNITVSVNITKPNPCHVNGVTYNVTVTASGTSRKLVGLVNDNNGTTTISWQAYQ